MRKKVSSIVLNVFLLLLGIVTVYPFIWMLCSSFKQNKEIMALQQHLLPQEFTIDNYISMNSHFNFMRFFGNSLFITIVVTLLVVYTSTICGFVLSKYKFKGRNILFGFVLATMMIPWCVTIIPKYTMIQKFGWMDSYKALIIPAMFSGFGIFMMKQHIETIPDEIIEAARMDGANEFYIFHRIIFPMAKNGISSIAIFQFLWTWEDYLWPYLVINTKEKQLLAVGLKMFNGQYSTDYGALFAATAISIIPVLLIYLFFQKQFIESVARMAPKRVVYVSCNPVTLARDLELLTRKGYKVESSTPVDMFPHSEHIETVCALSKLDIHQKITVDLKMDELDVTAAETKATYEEIREYVKEHTGLNVSDLYIAQVKQKCGIKERQNYNKPKAENPKRLKCPAEKERAIREALKYFKMI